MKGLLPWLLLFVAVFRANAHREHKIHNIVLYPDKHSWCEKQEIKQVISFSGCKSIEIDNNVCVGACFSYSIPHTEPSDPGEIIVPYCDSCQPSDTRWHEVTLDCREGHENDPEQASKLVKRVQIIKNCSCSSCEKSGLHNKYPGHNEEDDDSSLLIRDVPDLLDSMPNLNETVRDEVEIKHRENLRSILNNTLMTLVKNIQESNSAKDKAQLKDLLKMIRDQYPDEQESDEGIASLVESFKENTIRFDIPKLKEILFKFELSKHRHALETNEVHHYEHHSDSNELMNHLNKKHHHHHHHHAGEHVGPNDAHLVHGPHGSLVVEDKSTSIHSKIDINPHEFKPNHAGALLSYDSHHPEEASQEDNK